VAGVLLIYLALVAVGLSPARAPNASRYVYMGGILTLLLIAELGRDIKWTTVVAVAAFAIFGLSLMANVAELRVGGHLFEAEGATNRATLAALELSRNQVEPNFSVEDSTTVHSHPDMFFPAWAYFDASRDFGSPAFSLDQLLATGEQAREAADQELVRALAIVAGPVAVPKVNRRGARLKLLSAASGRARQMGVCLALIPDLAQTGSFQVGLPPGGFSYRTTPDAEVQVKLGRFAAPVTNLSPVNGSAEISIPSDASDTPWRAELNSKARAIVCPS
jgi:hypothetical protein